MSLEHFSCEYLLEEIRHLDFQMLDDATFQKIRQSIQLCSDPKKKMSLSLGGRIDPSYFDQESEVVTFLKVNQLDRKFLALRKQLSFDRERGPLLPVILRENSVTEMYWDELEQLVTPTCIRFFYKNEIAFQADKDLHLTSPFSIMGGGIMQYDPIRSGAIFPVEKSISESSTNWIELWKKQAAFIVLRSSKGSVYAIGTQDGHLVAPPEEYFVRWDGFERTRVEITEVKLKEMLRKIERDKYFWKVKRGENYLLNLCAPFEMR